MRRTHSLATLHTKVKYQDDGASNVLVQQALCKAWPELYGGTEILDVEAPALEALVRHYAMEWAKSIGPLV